MLMPMFTSFFSFEDNYFLHNRFSLDFLLVHCRTDHNQFPISLCFADSAKIKIISFDNPPVKTI